MELTEDELRDLAKDWAKTLPNHEDSVTMPMNFVPMGIRDILFPNAENEYDGAIDAQEFASNLPDKE